MPRLKAPDPSRYTPEQQRLADEIRRGPRGVVEGPVELWLTNPGFAARAQALGAYCRYDSALPSRLSELAIIATAAFWKSGFEWAVHAPIAERAGIKREIIEAIRTGREPEFSDREEEAVFRFSMSMWRHRQVPADLYQQAFATLGASGLVDLVGILGYYGLISMTINAFELPTPDGSKPFDAAERA